MDILIKAELNGRALYIVISNDSHDGETVVLAVTTDEAEAMDVVGSSNGGVAVKGFIFDDIRESLEA